MNLVKYRSLMPAAAMLATFGSFVFAQNIEEEAISDVIYCKNTEADKSQLDVNSDLSEKDFEKLRKRAKKEERRIKREERRARWRESNRDYRVNAERYHPYFDDGYSGFHYYGHGYGYPNLYGSWSRYRHYYRYRPSYRRHHHRRHYGG